MLKKLFFLVYIIQVYSISSVDLKPSNVEMQEERFKRLKLYFRKSGDRDNFLSKSKNEQQLFREDANINIRNNLYYITYKIKNLTLAEIYSIMAKLPNYDSIEYYRE